MAVEKPRAAESIGERLRRLRLKRGLSQRDLASPGVSYAYISRIEAGARRPSVSAIRKLARKLQISAHYLETGTEVREEDARDLQLAEAELKLRLEHDPAKLETEFAALLQEALQAGDAEAAMRARLGLGEAAARRGAFAEAIDRLESAVGSELVSPLSHPDTYVTLARSYSAVGQAERAVDLLERALQSVRGRAPEDVAAEVRFATYLGYALSDAGELARAREIVSEALARAGGGPDPYTRVRLYWSLARLALIEEKPRVALREISRAIGLLEATEDTRQLARAHLFCAEVMVDDEKPEAATPHLELAQRLFGENADAADLGWLWSEQARQAAQMGDHDRAATLASRTLEILHGVDPLKLARAHAALAEAHAAADATDQAEAAYRQAVDLFVGERRWREAVTTARAWAEMLRGAGRGGDAYDVLDRAAGYGARAEQAAP